MIKINGLTKKNGNKTIFENVSGLLKNRNIYALVGINGIGKSTMLNAITQPASMDGGTVEMELTVSCSGPDRIFSTFRTVKKCS